MFKNILCLMHNFLSFFLVTFVLNNVSNFVDGAFKIFKTESLSFIIYLNLC